MDIENRVSILEIAEKDTHRKIDGLADMTKEIHTALIGNYEKRGLIGRVADIEKVQDNCLAEKKEGHKKKIDWVTWAIRGSVGVMFAIMMAVIKGKI